MTAPIIAFFNNKGGVGKTSLVYHLAWMFSDLDLRVVAADLDPQANLSSAFLDDDRIEELWELVDKPNTIYRCVQPLIEGIGDISSPYLEEINESIALIAGDLSLSEFEGDLSIEWFKCLDGAPRAFRVVSSFWRVLQKAVESFAADIVLVDVGPNLGAINRAALIASDFVVVPLAPDLFSFQGLKNLGPTLKQWRSDWNKRLKEQPSTSSFLLPKGSMEPIGYIVLQHVVRLDRPVKAYQRWIQRIPTVYRENVLAQDDPGGLNIETDPFCLALLKNYQSLMPLAQEAHKPIFHLRPADGAIGAHTYAVKKAYGDFKQLAKVIAEHIELMSSS